MARFRRRRESEPNLQEPGEDLGGVDESSASPDEDPAGAGRSSGPWDDSEAERSDLSLERVDLGALLVPVLPSIGLQVEADSSSGEVRGITCVADDAAVQLLVWAAPRTSGIWDEVREEMLTEIAATSGASATEQDGPFGPELRANIPARSPEGRSVIQPVRFAGVDGPRWLLRATFLGRAAVRPDPDDDLHRIVREVIVVRGTEAMAPRDPLPLRLPPDAGQDVDQDEGEPDEGPAGIDPFERGPEITEVR